MQDVLACRCGAGGHTPTQGFLAASLAALAQRRVPSTDHSADGKGRAYYDITERGDDLPTAREIDISTVKSFFFQIAGEPPWAAVELRPKPLLRRRRSQQNSVFKKNLSRRSAAVVRRRRRGSSAGRWRAGVVSA